MTFELIPRRSLLVYLHNTRQARQLRRFGVVKYISEKAKYAVIYMNEEDIEVKKALIERLGFVDKVVISNWPEVDSTVGSDNETLEYVVDALDLPDEEIISEEEL
ncbi:MAG: YlbG family protein [Lactobacillaceae bacterium]|jgi:uncharacterized protein YlbG (UPF0298 family)|nr:YlbG family protein [Lactobacillaceae bacterium]